MRVRVEVGSESVIGLMDVQYTPVHDREASAESGERI